MFTGTSGTIAATANVSTLGRISDKSGNGNYARQGTAGSQPAWKSSGGLFWAEGDGLDDVMDLGAAIISASPPFTIMIAGQFAAGTLGAMLAQYAAGQAGRLTFGVNQNDSSSQSNGDINPFLNGTTNGAGSGGAALKLTPGNGTPFVFTYVGGSGSEQSYERLNGAEIDRFTISSVYQGANTQILGNATVGFTTVKRLHALLIVNRLATGAELANLEALFKAKCGASF